MEDKLPVLQNMMKQTFSDYVAFWSRS